MKVLDLCCSNDHAFEGWFGSIEDYDSQLARGLVSCPLCGDTAVNRLPSAARLSFGAAPQGEAGAEAQAQVVRTSEAQAALLNAVRQVMEQTEDVGDRFPEEARRIHYGEAPERGIRGRATPSEREALREEGIEVVPLPVPPALKGPLQ